MLYCIFLIFYEDCESLSKIWKNALFSGRERYKLDIQTPCNLSQAYVLSLSYSCTQFSSPLALYFEVSSTHEHGAIFVCLFLTLCLCLDTATPPCLTPFPSILNQPATSPTFLPAKCNCFSAACPSISPFPGLGHSSSVFPKYVFIVPYHDLLLSLSLG